ncbi:MAG: F0F1 ATP synthase subunit B [Lachnospiraceae bacterium]|nr:F0F1 ATP synthase subunit B [Lachnospiraceae bacterium]
MLVVERIFDLDLQLIHDSIFLAINIFILFTFMSYLLFNPVRDMLNKRRERIQNDIETAGRNKDDAIALKAEYEAKLRDIDKEAEKILSEARKKALRREEEIVNGAKEEANRILERAHGEVVLEQKRAVDDMKKEMIRIASAMAGRFVTQTMDGKTQDILIEETLKEIGDSTWQN